METGVVSLVVGGLVALALGTWAVASWILSYHWRSYALKDRVITRASRTYYAVSAVVFVLEFALLGTLVL